MDDNFANKDEKDFEGETELREEKIAQQSTRRDSDHSDLMKVYQRIQSCLFRDTLLQRSEEKNPELIEELRALFKQDIFFEEVNLNTHQTYHEEMPVIEALFFKELHRFRQLQSQFLCGSDHMGLVFVEAFANTKVQSLIEPIDIAKLKIHIAQLKHKGNDLIKENKDSIKGNHLIKDADQLLQDVNMFDLAYREAKYIPQRRQLSAVDFRLKCFNTLKKNAAIYAEPRNNVKDIAGNIVLCIFSGVVGYFIASAINKYCNKRWTFHFNTESQNLVNDIKDFLQINKIFK